MKKKIIIVLILASIDLLAYFMLIGRSDKITGNVVKPREFVKKSEEYTEDGLVIVSYDTHPELFKFNKIEDGYNERIVSVKAVYEVKEETADGSTKESTEEYDIDDEKIAELGTPSDLVVMTEKQNGYYLSYEKGMINEPYTLILPDEYEGEKIRQVTGIFDDQYIVSVSGARYCTRLDISDCEMLSKVELGDELKVFSCFQTPVIEEFNLEKLNKPSILYYLLDECATIKKAIIPETVKYMQYVLNYCEELNEIKLDDGLLAINYCFNSCNSLKEVYIPDSVVIIINSFKDCPDLCLSVAKGSAAEKYAIENELKYVYH